jgi:hypothetical protein
MFVKVIRVVLGIVVGHGLLALLITLVQENWFGGVGWHESPLGELLLAGFLSCVGAGIGAAVATIISRPTGRLAAVIMSCLIVVETTVLVVTGKADGPLWFDVVAAASLIVGILLGAETVLRLRAWTSGPRIAA